MRDNPNITTAELHQILGVSETAVEKNILFLRENGYIERIGSKKQDLSVSISGYAHNWLKV